MSVISGLQGTVNEITDAAIDWDMYLLGFYPSDGGWHGAAPGEGLMEWRVDHDGNVTQEGQPVDVPTGTRFDFKSLINRWRTDVPDAFRDWLTDLPEPSDFDDYVTQVGNAVITLAVNTEATPTSAGPGSLRSGNGTLDASLVTLCGEVSAMGGVALDALAAGYTSRVPGVIRGQKNVAAMLGCCLTAEQEVWKRTRADVSKLASDVLSVLKSHDNESQTAVFTALGGVVAGASLFLSGGAAAPFLGAAGSALGVISAFGPKDRAPKPAEITYSGDNPAAVFKKGTDALYQISSNLYGEEQVLVKSLTDSYGAVVGLGTIKNGVIETPNPVNLAVAPPFVKQDPHGVVPRSEIDVDPPSLAYLGKVVTHDIAQALETARGKTDGCTDVSLWERPSSIGFSSNGPGPQWMDLRAQLEYLEHSAAGSLTEVGVAMVDVAKQFVNVDDAVRQRMEQQKSRVGGG